MSEHPSFLNQFIRFCLENKLIVFLVALFLIVTGIINAPFDWQIESLPRSPVSVDAIPDIGENQQIVFTEWEGRSPQDVEDQVTYPLTAALLGTPKVKSIRSFSMFGFSSIYVIFDESAEFYWTRSRILEKLNSLPEATLPSGVQPVLGPDATPLGQVFWYTLEGRTPDGQPAGGWEPNELRSIQDFYVRYALQSVEGVAEVASIGGFVKEYQVDIDPDAMRAYGVSLEEVFNAVRSSNLDVGARTIEVNRVEYLIRGLGFIKAVEDLQKTVIKVHDHVPITLEQVAEVTLGPALRRGALDKEGAEAVGGVVVARFGANPLKVIKLVKEQLKAMQAGLPEKVLSDGTISKVTPVPFYDRSGLIKETLDTLSSALTEEILVTIIVVILMVMHLRSALLISLMLPISVLLCFIGMKRFGIDANIVALSGIAIAIGTIVDMGIVICENILKHFQKADDGESSLETVYRATSEVGSAVLTAVLTTVISFLPVFAMEGPEGKLFKPLAYTKTFALLASILIAISLLPPLAHLLFTRRKFKDTTQRYGAIALIALGALLFLFNRHLPWWVGLIPMAAGLWHFLKGHLSARMISWSHTAIIILLSLLTAAVLALNWQPLGPAIPARNILFVVILVGTLILCIYVFMQFYERILRACLRHKAPFFAGIFAIIGLGFTVWLGFNQVFAFLPDFVKNNRLWSTAYHAFPGLGKEFMPSLDEGSFLFMPNTMPHASIGEAMDVLQTQDRAIRNIPEVENVVGKIGRVDSPLDPAPVTMIETIINYKPEYTLNEQGKLTRQWRDEIKNPGDIWQEILKAGEIPGTTSAPKLQPIEARIVMLQTGMRSAMGVKIFGPDLKTVEEVGLEIEKHLKAVPSIVPTSIFAERIVGKPYLEISIEREAVARYGISISQVQDVIEVAIGGKPITYTVEGRERYPVRVRYQRELRDEIDSLGDILVPVGNESSIPLREIADIRFARGPEAIKSENTFLVGYVTFDKAAGFSEVQVVQQAQDYLEQKRNSGELKLPASVTYRFAGSYENQVRAEKKLLLVIPLALLLIFLIIYYQFHSVPTTLLVFFGIFIAWSGGFILIWLYNQSWFLNFSVVGVELRTFFQVSPINLSVAVWVGFLALFGIATDDGVIMGTYLSQLFAEKKPTTIESIRETTVEAALKRMRPALMTSTTTILALLPVLSSTGRGADVMVPMAIPTFGGMLLATITLLTVPTMFCMIQETRLRAVEKLQNVSL